jgi:chromosome segregation ATPase
MRPPYPGPNPTELHLDFRKVFILALIAGSSAIGYSQVTGDALTAVAGPLLVMALYLGIGIRHAEPGERIEQFADSLYYLGFLFTLVALTASLLAYRTVEVEFNLLVANFALALVTTIFGLAARIVIVHFRHSPVDRNTLQDILDHQTAKLCRTASQISRELEFVSREINQHHKARMDENALRLETAYRAIESLSEKAADSINGIAGTAATEISQTLGELRGRLESAHFPEELFAEKLATPIARFAEKLDDAGDLLSEFQNRQQTMLEGMRSAAESFQEFDQRIAGLSLTVKGFNQHLENDQGARQQLVALAQTMTTIIGSSTSLTRELHQQTENSRQIMSILGAIVEQLNRIPAEVDVTTSAIRQSTHTLIKNSTVLASHSGTVRENLDGFSKDLGELRQRFNGLDTLTSRVDKASQSLGSLIETLQSRSESLSGLEQSAREELEMINRHQQDLQRILAESRAGLEGITNHFVRAVEYVTEKLRA